MKSSGKLLALLPLLFLCLAAAPAKKGPKYDPGIEVGQDAHGLQLPVFDEAGNKQMYFVIDVAKRIDEDHMQMSTVHLQTFDAKEKPEMKIDMRDAVLDLNTRIVTTQKPVVVVRADFRLTGDRAVYDTASGDGKLSGNIKMIIYDVEGASAGKAGS